MFEEFPYTNFHDLNLDWLIEKIQSAYGPDNPPPVGLVLSVNGQTGAVVLYQGQYVRFPDVPEDVWTIFRNANGTPSGFQFENGQPAKRIDGVNRYAVYDEGNPPPSAVPPVNSVDGMTGTVKTWANTSNASMTTPEEAPGLVWEINRELSNGNKLGLEVEYDSVNSTYKAYVKYSPAGGTAVRQELLTSAVIPQTGVTSVNNMSGVVVLTGNNIASEAGSQDSIATVLSNLASDISDINDALTPMGTDITTIKNNITNIEGSIGIVENTDTATHAINQGEYVMWKGGLYKASSNIAINDPLSIYNLTAVTGGGLNDITVPAPTPMGHTIIKQVIADGVKTYKQILNEFFIAYDALQPIEKYFSVFRIGANVFQFGAWTNSIPGIYYVPGEYNNPASSIFLHQLYLDSSDSHYYSLHTNPDNSWSTTVRDDMIVTSGIEFVLYV